MGKGSINALVTLVIVAIILVGCGEIETIGKAFHSVDSFCGDGHCNVGPEIGSVSGLEGAAIRRTAMSGQGICYGRGVVGAEALVLGLVMISV
jgi:hypothetical protein|tara:strand:+ start:518 stop:796 length:279 start_codon:yes stop_codon:yes gene_type:complete